MKKVVLLAMAALLFCMQMLTACTEKGLKIGFGWNTSGRIICAVKSDITDFYKDDVTLDFYYGLYEKSSLGTTDKNYIEICIALYFMNAWVNLSEIPIYFEDYKEIENLYFIKEISFDEVRSEEYKVTYKALTSCKGEYIFSHQESLTIPEEFFIPYTHEPGRGTRGVRFLVRQIVYSQKDETYYSLSSWGSLSIGYIFLDDKYQKVKLNRYSYQ